MSAKLFNMCPCPDITWRRKNHALILKLEGLENKLKENKATEAKQEKKVRVGDF